MLRVQQHQSDYTIDPSSQEPVSLVIKRMKKRKGMDCSTIMLCGILAMVVIPLLFPEEPKRKNLFPMIKYNEMKQFCATFGGEFEGQKERVAKCSLDYSSISLKPMVKEFEKPLREVVQKCINIPSSHIIIHGKETYHFENYESYFQVICRTKDKIIETNVCGKQVMAETCSRTYIPYT